jgi:hypothetical protein
VYEILKAVLMGAVGGFLALVAVELVRYARRRKP